MRRLRLKKLRRRFGITAPRVAVQSHVPWYWRWLTSTIFLVVTVTVAWVAYDIGRRYAGFDSSEAEGAQSRLQELNGQLQQENSWPLSSSVTVTSCSRAQADAQDSCSDGVDDGARLGVATCSQA